MELSRASVLASPDPTGTVSDRSALARVWPLFGLAVRTPRLVLAVPTDADLVRLAEVAADIHEPGARPLTAPWTGRLGRDRDRALLQHHWESRASWSAVRWSLDLAVWHDRDLIGVQTLRAQDFTVRRTVQTASWLHRSRQGAGIGTEMRRAALHLAFAGLGAQRAETEAHESNLASLTVTARLGYRPNGEDLRVDAHGRRRVLRFVLEVDDRPPDLGTGVVLEGLEPCRPLLGADPG
jgi:RimJ/RimL family protein N-acetyltransferase